MPRNFTICAAYMVKAWTTPFASAIFFNLLDSVFQNWAYVDIFASFTSTTFTVTLGKVFISTYTNTFTFLFTWTRICLSLDTGSGKIVLVVNGHILEDKIHPLAALEDDKRPANLVLTSGFKDGLEFTGMVSNINMFTSPLATGRMVNLTSAGGEECGASGDYVSWEDEEWRLHSQARIEMVGDLNGPCRRESEVTVYSANFQYHSAATNVQKISGCMEHCQKLGKGRSPPLRTQKEHEWLRAEVTGITPKISDLPTFWVAANDDDKEGEWRDPYTGEILNTTAVWWPWYSTKKDRFYGNGYDCLNWRTEFDVQPMNYLDEWQCDSYDKGCACQTSEQPVLLMRGLCLTTGLDRQYIPRQLATAPKDLKLMGQISTQIQYNHTSTQWILTDAKSNTRAVSNATEVSYVLGTHEWTITNDASCNEGQPYTTFLKLTGCNVRAGDFTCNDGQCVTMEQRCDQLPNCRDESDEKDCKLVVLKKGYNKNVPPITTVSDTDFTLVPAPVHISISLLKIVNMEEVQHKIDLQFGIILKWRENRATYYNLKNKTNLNALTEDDIRSLWLPYVIYANTDMKEAVQLVDGVVDTTIVVTREGAFSQTMVDEVDEAEIFAGKQNTLAMYQTYTKSFQCLYNLRKYPFDTQVSQRTNRNKAKQSVLNSFVSTILMIKKWHHPNHPHHNHHHTYKKNNNNHNTHNQRQKKTHICYFGRLSTMGKVLG